MRRNHLFSDYAEYYEYHGNTTIERVRKQSGEIIHRDWLLFNTVKEASDYFFDHCSACMHPDPV
jgi:hypothetical protein